MKKQLDGKKVAVIGGSSGIGLATAKMAHDEGAHVYIAGRTAAKLQAAAPIIGPNVTTFVVEATDEATIEAMFAQIEELDHLIVTASDVALGGIRDTPSASLKSTLDSRFWGSYHAAKYAAPKLRPGGSITYMSETAVYKPSAGGAVAAASGAAVESLGWTLAVELAPIRVNTRRAGAIDTPLLDVFFGDEKTAVTARLAQSLPVKTMGQPEDIAQAALFLMTSPYSTGTVLTVDGGVLLT